MLSRFRRSKNGEGDSAPAATVEEVHIDLDITDRDPLMAYLLDAGGPVEVAGLELASPALTALREAGVELVIPLISQGELIGTLNLGHRLSDQPYSADDRRLLAGLAARVAPAIRVAQLVREQEAEAEERQRIEQELEVAALIQQTLLPKQLPMIAGWEIDAFYRPARAVGGDFYDAIEMPDGRLALVVGDVTDKGVPAALVMATCRSMLRAAAQRYTDPGEVLADVNEALVPEIPERMFVTCLYAIVQPATGELVYANAGHNLPYVRTEDGVEELRATGMPLGLLPGSKYEVATARLAPGETMLLSSDGIVEAHDPEGSMYGFPRLRDKVGDHPGGSELISALIEDLDEFAGVDAEQEDDVTLLVARRLASARDSAGVLMEQAPPEVLASFSIPSETGAEREAMERVAEAVAQLDLDDATTQKLQTAVSEAAMNAIEHGNRNNAELPVDIKVEATTRELVVRITDQGGSRDIPDAEAPDLEAKLAGDQRARGWGLFLIEHMVDEMRLNGDGEHHHIELVVRRKGVQDARTAL